MIEEDVLQFADLFVDVYWSDLDVPFEASAGVPYWLSIYNSDANARWDWLGANDIGDGVSQTLDPPGNDWILVQDDRAFQLTDSVIPEPITATLGLVGLGALGLAIGRRRRACASKPRSDENQPPAMSRGLLFKRQPRRCSRCLCCVSCVGWNYGTLGFALRQRGFCGAGLVPMLRRLATIAALAILLAGMLWLSPRRPVPEPPPAPVYGPTPGTDLAPVTGNELAAYLERREVKRRYAGPR